MICVSVVEQLVSIRQLAALLSVVMHQVVYLLATNNSTGLRTE